MKKKTKSRLIDSSVVLLCLAVAGISLFMFWKDMNSSSGRDGETIGTIEYKYKIAQRKFSDRVVWERLQQKSPLYNADTIRTADGAIAKITFEDDSVIEIHENTMIQIFYSPEEGASLSVDGGNISVDTTNSKSNLSVSMSNGSKFTLSSGSKVTAVSDSSTGENSFQITEGKASVVNAEGKEEEIHGGESIRVNAAGSVKKESLTVTSVSSDMKVLKFGQEDEKNIPVDITWVTSDEKSTEPVIIETSADKNFKTIKNTYTKTGSDSVEVQTTEGNLYWRIYTQNNIDEAVEGKISVENIEKPELTSPVNGSQFKYVKDPPALNFNWVYSDYADMYKLEILKGDGSVIEKEVTEGNFIMSNLEAGEYRWRIVPHYAVNDVGYGEPSDYYTFEISKKESVNPPVPTVPAEDAKITMDQDSSKVAFRWKSEIKDGEYTLKVAKDPDFKDEIFEEETAGKNLTRSFDKNELPEGEYYWKVIRKSSEEGMPSESEVRSFEVLKTEVIASGESKLVYPPDNYMVEKTNLSSTDFIWKLSDAAKNEESVLQFSRSPDFSGNLISLKTEDSILNNVKLPSEGKYYWRVANKAVDTGFTDVRTITLLEPLEKPVIISPAAGSIQSVYGAKTVSVNWKPVDGASYYKLKITEKGSGKTVKEINQKNTAAEVQLPAQNYNLSVQAFSDETELCAFRSGNIAETSFTLRNPVPVTLTSPVKGAKLNGLDALKNPVNFTWKYGDKADTVQVVLKKMQPDGSYKTIFTKNENSGKCDITRLTAGSYQWQIKASAKNGMILDSKTESFMINPVPELSKAVLTQPENLLVMDAAYLRKHRTLEFEWEKVEGATDYTFAVYQKNSNGTYRKVYEQTNIKAPEAKLKDLSVLDIGNFEWRVTAYCHARDGFEEQHSRQSTGRFDIRFERPGSIQTNDPGKMYGE